MQIGTVTLSRRAVYPVKYSDGRDQNVFIAGGGEVRAQNRGENERLVTYTIRNIARSEFEDLRDYLEGESGANYKGNSFTIVDDWSVSFSVRWWDKRLKYVQKVGRLFDVTITFRIEAA